MDDSKLIDKVKEKFGALVLDSHNFRGDQTVTVKKDCGLEFSASCGTIRTSP